MGEYPKPPRSKNQMDFVGGTWSSSGEDEEERTKDETCLVAQVSNEDVRITSWIECCQNSEMRQQVVAVISNYFWLEVMLRNVWIHVILDISSAFVDLASVLTTSLLHGRLESIRIILEYACALDFKLFQMDVKSAFLNSFINEEVYVAQPPGFIDFTKPNNVYRLKKVFYGLEQAPKAWRLCRPKKHWRYLYVYGILFNILVFEEAYHSSYIHYQSQIRKRQKGMPTSTMDETSSR
ncbi:copia protein [Tanacetum coccineum]